MSKKIKIKRLFFDIETSFNIVASWNIGYNLNISHENILKERAVICICYKWAGESKIYHLSWNNGDDKQMLIDFIKVLNEADEIISHNGDKFDIKWIRTRCLLHGIPMMPDYISLDTLKASKSGFKFNSNRLDYLGKVMGFGGKLKTRGFDLWKEVCLDNNQKSLEEMVKYCKVDVQRLEEVFNKLNPYIKSKTHHGIRNDNSKCSCPNCGSENTTKKGTRITAKGVIQQQMQCGNCGKYFTVSQTEYNKR